MDEPRPPLPANRIAHHFVTYAAFASEERSEAELPRTMFVGLLMAVAAPPVCCTLINVAADRNARRLTSSGRTSGCAMMGQSLRERGHCSRSEANEAQCQEWACKQRYRRKLNPRACLFSKASYASEFETTFRWMRLPRARARDRTKERVD